MISVCGLLSPHGRRDWAAVVGFVVRWRQPTRLPAEKYLFIRKRRMSAGMLHRYFPPGTLTAACGHPSGPLWHLCLPRPDQNPEKGYRDDEADNPLTEHCYRRAEVL